MFFLWQFWMNDGPYFCIYVSKWLSIVLNMFSIHIVSGNFLKKFHVRHVDSTSSDIFIFCWFLCFCQQFPLLNLCSEEKKWYTVFCSNFMTFRAMDFILMGWIYYDGKFFGYPDISILNLEMRYFQKKMWNIIFSKITIFGGMTSKIEFEQN